MIHGMSVFYNDKAASLQMNTDSWTLKIQCYDSVNPEVEINLSEITKIDVWYMEATLRDKPEIYIKTTHQYLILPYNAHPLNNGTHFVRAARDLICSGNYQVYKQARKNFAITSLILLTILSIFNIVLWLLVRILE